MKKTNIHAHGNISMPAKLSSSFPFIGYRPRPKQGNYKKEI